MHALRSHTGTPQHRGLELRLKGLGFRVKGPDTSPEVTHGHHTVVGLRMEGIGFGA